MKFYAKIFKDGKQVFEGWNDSKKYKTFINKLFKKEEYYEDYNVLLEDYSSQTSCGSWLLEEFKETTLDVFDELIDKVEILETAEDFYNQLNDTSDVFDSEFYEFNEETIN